ncbi:MAG TPA: CapA family protein [Gemmatimonadales bacterium]|nr:CapA family protein [Gemmatimonadales bacterium]
MSRRAGLALALGAAAACAGSTPAPVPSPGPDTVAARPGPPAPTPIPLPAPAPPRRMLAGVRLALVGDINLGTSTLADGIPPDSGRTLLSAVGPSLQGDLVIGNFEGVLADTGTSAKCARMRLEDRARARAKAASRPRPSAARKARAERLRARRAKADSILADSLRAQGLHADSLRADSLLARINPPDTTAARPGCYAFRTPVMLAPRLVEAGFTHLNLANNHANDYGPAGVASTQRTLDSLGLRWYGPLGRIAIDSVRRGDSVTVVGLIGFATYPYAYDLLDVARSAQVVDSVRRLVDLLVVTFHGGAEGRRALRVPEAAESLGREPRGELRRWARAMVDAGADAVVGHGPHVLRGMEFYRGRLIAYSLGNFLTYRGFNLEGPLGVTGVLQLEFAPGQRLARARLVPLVQRPKEGPTPDPEGTAARLVGELSAEDFGPTAATMISDGTIRPPP